MKKLLQKIDSEVVFYTIETILCIVGLIVAIYCIIQTFSIIDSRTYYYELANGETGRAEICRKSRFGDLVCGTSNGYVEPVKWWFEVKDEK